MMKAQRIPSHLEAVAELTRASLALRLRPRSGTAVLLGRIADAAETPAVSAAQLRQARSIAGTVARDARRLPWQPTCLRQALAARRMLRRRGIPNRLHLGVAGGEEAEAHAWVTVGGQTVIGAHEQGRFVPIAAFV